MDLAPREPLKALIKREDGGGTLQSAHMQCGRWVQHLLYYSYFLLGMSVLPKSLIRSFDLQQFVLTPNIDRLNSYAAVLQPMESRAANSQKDSDVIGHGI